MKPMLASDWKEDKLKLPCILEPKVDGVRSLTALGPLTGRSLKQHKNKYTTAFFSRPEYAHLDGEMAAQDERHPELCRLTSSALARIDGQPFILWHVFDLLTPEALQKPYHDRLHMLEDHVRALQAEGKAGHLRVIPWKYCTTLEEVLYWDTLWLEQGYEGSIVRDPEGMHKQGRSTVREGGLLRIKRFVDFEFVVTGVTEGQHNGNPEKTNELGQTERSTHQENMVPNGMVGNLIGTVCEEVRDAQTDAVLMTKGQIITVGAGRMDHNARLRYFQNQSELIGQTCKAQMFPKGIKDKPRFPTFQCIRSPEDMSS